MADHRLSDAACLACGEVDMSSIALFNYKPHLIVRDLSLPLQEQTLYSGPDTDLLAAESAYKIAFYRKLLTAALNVN